MPIGLIANREQMGSIRGKLNDAITRLNTIGDGGDDDVFAPPLGAVADTAALIAARAAVLADYFLIPGQSDYKLKSRGLFFAAGHYVINAAEAMMTEDAPAVKAHGFNVTGAGQRNTWVEYAPTVAGGYLLKNKKLYGFKFEDLTFYSQDALNSFAHHQVTEAQGWSPQDFKHENVSWIGSWLYGYRLEGDNNNSEGVWKSCDISGLFAGAFLQTNHDQNVNYWFEHCGVGLSLNSATRSYFIDAVLGGNFKVRDCNLIGEEATWFKLQTGSHNDGVQSFQSSGNRYELRADTSKILECAWNHGTVSFTDDDFSSHANLGFTKSTVVFDFNLGGGRAFPVISFTRCLLIGSFRFAHDTETYRHKKSITFRECEFLQHDDLTEAFIFTSSTNDNGQPAIDIEGCKGKNRQLSDVTAWAAGVVVTVGLQRRNGFGLYEVTVGGTTAGSGGPTGKGSAIVDNTATWKWVANDGSDYQNDMVLNWKIAGASPKRRIAHFRNASGNIPGSTDGNVEIILPPGAIVTRTRFYAAAAAYSASSTINNQIQTWEASPTVFSTITTGAYNAGFEDIWEGEFEVGTDILKRTLRFMTASGTNQTPHGPLAIVEYLA